MYKNHFTCSFYELWSHFIQSHCIYLQQYQIQFSLVKLNYWLNLENQWGCLLKQRFMLSSRLRLPPWAACSGHRPCPPWSPESHHAWPQPGLESQWLRTSGPDFRRGRSWAPQRASPRETPSCRRTSPLVTGHRNRRWPQHCPQPHRMSWAWEWSPGMGGTSGQRSSTGSDSSIKCTFMGIKQVILTNSYLPLQCNICINWTSISFQKLGPLQRIHLLW